MTVLTLIDNPVEDDVLARNLQLLMEKTGISEAELARKTNVPQPTLHKLLSGKTTDPRISTVKLLADYFKVELGDLYSNAVAQNNLHSFIKSKSVPVISWEDCVKRSNPASNLTPQNWDQWAVIDQASSDKVYGLVSRPSMEPRFPRGTILIIDPEIIPDDGDLVIVKYLNTTEATLREISIDGPNKLLIPVSHNLTPDKFDNTTEIVGTVIQSRFIYTTNT